MVLGSTLQDFGGPTSQARFHIHTALRWSLAGLAASRRRAHSAEQQVKPSEEKREPTVFFFCLYPGQLCAQTGYRAWCDRMCPYDKLTHNFQAVPADHPTSSQQKPKLYLRRTGRSLPLLGELLRKLKKRTQHLPTKNSSKLHPTEPGASSWQNASIWETAGGSHPPPFICFTTWHWTENSASTKSQMEKPSKDKKKKTRREKGS